ncbi:MAG: tripartite tricarboxylate transporter TctB family protein [Variibacter sp.]
MTQVDKTVAERPPMWGVIRNPQDFFGGLALVALAAVAFWASSDLPGMQGIQFGPGTAPRLFMGLLALNALAIMAHAVVVTGPPLERFAIRGPLFVTAAVFVFAATIRTLGLIPSSFLLVVVSSLATPEMRWLETLIWGAVLAAFCAVLFPYVLNLPMALWPSFF